MLQRIDNLAVYKEWEMSSFTMLEEAPLFETQNARMRSYASPSLNGSGLAVWRTEMDGGTAGPLHRADREQILVVVAGRVRVTFGEDARNLGPGDAAIIPADVQRTVSNPFTEQAILIAAGEPNATAETRTASQVPIPWTA
jgi:quercetin dioxygenase-like cupin family protein